MTTSTLPHLRRPRVAAALAVASLVVVAGCGGTDAPRTTPTPSSPYSPYVAMGDSYSAVSGTDGEFGDACMRSDAAYPNLVADQLGISDFATVACGGAVSANLKGTQYPLGKDRQDPQIDALSSATKLVTIGIGLNDENYFIQTVAPCFLLNGREQKACKPFLDTPQAVFDDLVTRIGDNVTADLAAIKEAAPNARIVFVGYPRLLPDRGSCSDQVPLAKKAISRVRSSGVDVNAMLKKVADRAGVDFVDMYAASEGHDVCSRTPWVNGYRTIAGEAYYFHPFPAYHEAVANEIARLLGAS